MKVQDSADISRNRDRHRDGGRSNRWMAQRVQSKTAMCEGGSATAHKVMLDLEGSRSPRGGERPKARSGEQSRHRVTLQKRKKSPRNPNIGEGQDGRTQGGRDRGVGIRPTTKGDAQITGKGTQQPRGGMPTKDQLNNQGRMGDSTENQIQVGTGSEQPTRAKGGGILQATAVEDATGDAPQRSVRRRRKRTRGGAGTTEAGGGSGGGLLRDRQGAPGGSER